MKSALLLAVVMTGAILGGCGQKGPLVLPDAPKHKRAVPNPRAPATPATGNSPASGPAASPAPAPASPPPSTP